MMTGVLLSIKYNSCFLGKLDGAQRNPHPPSYSILTENYAYINVLNIVCKLFNIAIKGLPQHIATRLA
jgi:hypothetical protein